MNILTKICVVVLAVLVLCAAPVFITQATVGPNYRHLYVQEKERNATWQENSVAERLRSDLLARQLTAVQQSADAAQQQRVAERDAQAAELVSLRHEKDERAAEAARLGADVARLTTVVGSDRARIDALSGDLAKTQDDFSKANKEVMELRTELGKYTAAAERNEQLVRVLREEMARVASENKGLRAQMEKGVVPATKTMPGPTEPSVAVPEVAGKISAVQQDIASINIGSVNGVRPGMKMMIYRDAQFVGNLVIEEVDVSSAVGIIVEKRLDPMQGDKVSSNPD